MRADVQPVIFTRGLARSFGNGTAVAGLDLEIQRGEMFGLVGPDSAGKSTAIRLLCGILGATGGSARILGFDLSTETEHIKARIGYLSQAFTLYGDLTLDENIEFFAEIHGVRNFEKRRDELLEFTRLTSFRKRLAGALSGGMKKKLALACTLIHTPDILFLDEPSTGVDPVSRGEFWNILSGILEQGVTILMTTPYLDEADRCHRIALMHKGRIIQTGTPNEVKAALPGKVFRIEGPNLGKAYRSLRQKRTSAGLVLYSDRLNFWTPHGEPDARESAAWLEQQGLGPIRIFEIPPSLEDVFVALMGSDAPHGGQS